MSLLSPKKLLSTQNPKSLAGSWLFTILWCGISFPIFYVFAFKERSLFGGAIGGLFTLLGVAMLYASIKLTLEYLKYGAVHLQLEGAAPATGQSFGAKINLPTNAAAAGRISAELACVRVTWTRGSKGAPSKGEKDAWTRQQVFAVRRSALGDYAAFRIDVPGDKPPSDLPGELAPDAVVEIGSPGGIEVGRDYYRWELRVKVDVPGIDFERTFYLRVGAGTQAAATVAPRVDPVMMDTQLHERLLARRAATRKLSMISAFVGMAPFVVPFAIAGLAVGLAGCPMSWNASNPPTCTFGGINWGPVMSHSFDLMFTAVPVGIAASIVIFVAGQAWIARASDSAGADSPRFGVPLAGLVVAGILVFVVWDVFRPAKKLQPPVIQPSTAPPVAAGETKRAPAASGDWQESMEQRLRQSVASIEKSGNGDRPVAALALWRLSQEYEAKKRTAEQEQALLHSLAILERYADSEVKAELDAGGTGLDKEVVARRLADIYWDQRNYARAFDHYDRAYRYAREVQATDSSLNLRLARNSAGRMATACMLGNWDVADAAMAELKERIRRTDAAEQKRLDYWIRTGEPRLAARKC